jgi:hypothetical protein
MNVENICVDHYICERISILQGPFTVQRFVHCWLVSNYEVYNLLQSFLNCIKTTKEYNTLM